MGFTHEFTLGLPLNNKKQIVLFTLELPLNFAIFTPPRHYSDMYINYSRNDGFNV